MSITRRNPNEDQRAAGSPDEILHRAYRCNCKLCNRGRRIKAIASKLQKEDREWLLAFYDYVFEMEAEQEMEKASK